MSLQPGTRLGPYEVLVQIGVGGMGEVYKATDTNLKRSVAIKVLPASVAGDADRLARFQREAEVLAALNHPNIAQIYELERSSGVQALVMELVEGADLSQRIARGPIPLDEALLIAKQIAEALAAAHDQGIIHRDLKPANVKLSSDGVVKVLDFGLAKALAPTGAMAVSNSMSPTITTPAMTQAGMILGTAAYMSPEQAKGQEADKRSDIWAFGCVLYEMLTGQRAFAGGSVAEVLASVLKSDPDLARLPAAVPPTLVRLLRRSLEKDQRQRLDSAVAVRLEIDDALKRSPQDARTLSTRPTAPFGRLAIGLGVLVIGAASSLATWTVSHRTPSSPSAPLVRLEVVPSTALALWSTVDAPNVAMSPDGSQVAYVGSATATGERQLVLRRLDELEGVPLPGTMGARGPFFSPDGRWLAFFAGNEIKKVPVAGGAPMPVCRIVPRDDNVNASGSWDSNDRIIFTVGLNSGGLQAVPAAGGEPTVLAMPVTGTLERGFAFPAVFPGMSAALLTVRGFDGPIGDHIDVLDLDSGRRKTLIAHGSRAQWADSEHIVYLAGGTLMATRLEPTRMEVTGDPVPVVAGAPSTGFAVSRNGTLVYVPGVASNGLAGAIVTTRSLVWVDRHGRELSTGAPSRNYAVVRLSPDGTRAVAEVRGTPTDLWTWDFARQVLSRLTTETGDGSNPVWAPDGQRVAFLSVRTGLPLVFSQRADGVGVPEQLTDDGNPGNPKAATPDGKSLLTAGTRGVYLISLDRRSSGRVLLSSAALQNNPDVSPDGRWLAYQSDESGTNEVYVRPFPNVNNGRWQVSTAGGVQPVWSRSGGELFYLDRDGLLTTVAVHSAPTFSADRPTRLLDVRYIGGAGTRTYDVAPDGQRFLMMKNAAEDAGDRPDNIVVVLNWLEELKRLVPTK